MRALEVSAFDALAEDYDRAFSASPLGTVLRELVWSRIRVRFASAQRVLDLGCGTGEDALRLAESVEHVVGVDASAGMIRVARAKAAARGLALRVEFICEPIERLDAVLGSQRFDAVLSNFGALNCIADLTEVVRSVARHLEPEAPLLWVLMGRHVPWEWLWFLCRGQPLRAWRRLGNPGVRWRGQLVHYPGPAEVMAKLRTEFQIDALRPLGWILPPSYAAGWLDHKPRLLASLARLERRTLGMARLAHFSDHYLVEATRLALPQPAVSHDRAH